MAIRWSWASPRIALIPALAVTVVAFFGAILWTVWISFTRSRRFPDYALNFEDLSRQYDRLFGDGAWVTSLQNIIVLAIGSALA